MGRVNEEEIETPCGGGDEEGVYIGVLPGI